jgi:RHS repeat-associated protein
MTNATGAVVSRSSYDVFGERALASAYDVVQPFGFTGREHDAGSGLVYARARYLQPGVGRWTITDPLGFVAGPNFYRYVRNDPVSLADPEGLSAAPAWPVPTPTPYPPAANQPMRAAPVYDTMTAYAVYHPMAFLALMMDLGVIAGEVYAKVAKECDENNDSVQQFWRGDSKSRAWASVTGGFIAAGIGTELGQLGYGLYMSRERSVALRYGRNTPKQYAPGAVLEIFIRTRIWRAVMAMGAIDGVPIAGEDGSQSFVPTGAPLELFDQASYKIIDEEL